MDKTTMIQQLKEAIGLEQDALADANKFKKIGFDGGKARLGWAKAPSFEQIEEALNTFLKKAEGMEEFIFVGMGGSANGIKTLIELSGSKTIHACDSLDPAAFEDVLSKIKDISKTLIVPISKSGTTKETQLVATAFKNVYGETYDANFLWIGDPNACENLDKLGWDKAEKMNIQVDKGSDIGGRFSSPQTMVFFAPLILILNRDISAFKNAWDQFAASQDDLVSAAADEALKYVDQKDIRLFVEVRSEIVTGVANWIIQLIQESIGSKDSSLFIKTLVGAYGTTPEGFSTVKIADEGEPYVYVMKYMYFLQVLTALLSYVTDVCFVDQPYVEVYKKELKSLEGKVIDEPQAVDLDGMVELVKGQLKEEQEFIDVVLFYHASAAEMKAVQDALASAFGDKTVTVFIGSDWNHHSYQAAFGDTKTLFVVANRQAYSSTDKISAQDAKNGLDTLKAISFATYKTIADKCVYCAL